MLRLSSQVFYSLSIVILFKNSREKVARLHLYSIHISNGSHPFLGYQYTPLLEAPKPTPSIPCYNTQVNAIKQLLCHRETLMMCWGALWRDVGGKPPVTFDGSCTKRQSSYNCKRTVHTNIVKAFSPRNSKHFCQRSKAVAVASFPLRLTEHISEWWVSEQGSRKFAIF